MRSNVKIKADLGSKVIKSVDLGGEYSFCLAPFRAPMDGDWLDLGELHLDPINPSYSDFFPIGGSNILLVKPLIMPQDMTHLEANIRMRCVFYDQEKDPVTISTTVPLAPMAPVYEDGLLVLYPLILEIRGLFPFARIHIFGAESDFDIYLKIKTK